MRTRSITLLFALLFGFIISFAQIGHLKFKGVPIDGTLNSFTSKLTKKGFSVIQKGDNTTLMNGSFAGQNDCLAYIFRDEKIDVVNGVVLYFPSLDSWSALEGQYNSIKDLLIEKYGKPADVIEEFQSRVQPRDDNCKLHELKFDRCTYKTIFEIEEGRIILALAKLDYNECCVSLVYADAINGTISRQSMLEDL